MSIDHEQGYILCYTRLPQEELLYAPKLAYSMHLAYSKNGRAYKALNNNSGVFFAKATDNENGTLTAKSLKKPYLFALKDGGFGVMAIRTEADGANDELSKGSVLLAVTNDLLQYEEIGLLDLKGSVFVEDAACHYSEAKKGYVITWSDESGKGYENVIADLSKPGEISAPALAQPPVLESVSAEIEGIQARNHIAVPKSIADRLVGKLTSPHHVGTEGPGAITVSGKAQLREVKAKALYSDGTVSPKNVDWQTEGVDWSSEGTYEIKGTLRQTFFDFPFASHRADPNIARWKGKYYFIATNDADGQKTFSVREAETLEGLVDAQEVQIINSETYEHIGGLLWAPEFHIIEDDLYIFHAATPKEFFEEEAHVMKLKKDGNPLSAGDWSEPRRVVRMDGSDLCEAGKTISLDMTVIHWEGEIYAAWSERQFLPDDLGAWLYLAKLDLKEPWRLASEPILLSKPDYGWANNRTFVDEGPFPLYGENKLFLTFSSAATDASYCVGLLTIDNGADLLNPANWTKGNYPLLTSRNVPGEYGPGHNSYVTDDDGIVWNVYHAKAGLDDPRCSGLRRVHFDGEGYPVLDLTQDKDLNEALAEVTATVTVKPEYR
ncbi:family 43 glycosylhydrolase [Paenibacillus sp. CAU 1782]